MIICEKGHTRIVHNNKYGCPMCQILKHSNQVHDFIESKGNDLIMELVNYQRAITEKETKNDNT